MPEHPQLCVCVLQTLLICCASESVSIFNSCVVFYVATPATQQVLSCDSDKGWQSTNSVREKYSPTHTSTYTHTHTQVQTLGTCANTHQHTAQKQMIHSLNCSKESGIWGGAYWSVRISSLNKPWDMKMLLNTLPPSTFTHTERHFHLAFIIICI